METLTITVLAIAAVLAAANAGAFLAFSTFVMPALRELDVAEGTRAMQAINRKAPPPFIVTLLGGIVAGAVGAYLAGNAGGVTAGWWAGVGAGLAVLTLVLTAVFNIPRNDRLARVDATMSDGAIWRTYLTEWTRANTVRSIASAAAVACFVVGAAAVAA